MKISWESLRKQVEEILQPILEQSGYEFLEITESEEKPSIVFWFGKGDTKATIDVIERTIFEDGKIKNKKWLRVYAGDGNLKVRCVETDSDDMHEQMGWLYESTSELENIIAEIAALLKTDLGAS